MKNVLPTATADWIVHLDDTGFGCKMVPFDVWPLVHLGATLEELPPGRAICPLHYHMLEEEFLYVVDGELTIRELAEGVHREFSLRQDELIAWLPGTRIAHQTLNRSGRPARYLAMSDRQAQEIAVYPDSGKVLLRGVGVGVWTPAGQTPEPLAAHFAAARAKTALPVVRLSDDERPAHVVGRGQVPERSLGALGGFGRPLSRAAGAKSVFINVDRLPPGARTSDLHAHLGDEEVVFVLEGTPTLRQQQGRREGRTAVFDAPAEGLQLAPGDAVHWAPGDLKAHQLLNESASDVRLLVLGTDLDHDIVLYPERGQVYSPVLGSVGRLEPTDYLAGEAGPRGPA
ncbi:MAG: cupin domain-containing protein [Deltaproteobacteria bacterium]|nr:cupin domain-containing protein [Deltaproteobacteria bacterium]